jgi:uncharacterized protein YjbJ (UPF0337 family)
MAQATDQAQEKATQVAGQAQEKAQEVAGQAKEQATQVAGQAKGQLRSQVDQRSTQAGEQVKTQANDLKSLADSLREQGKTGPADMAHKAATKAEGLGDYLTRADADTLLSDLEDLGRKNPMVVALGGLAIGFAASRFLKASSQERYQTRVTTGYGTGTTGGTPQLPARSGMGGTGTAGLGADSGIGTAPAPATGLGTGTPGDVDELANPAPVTGYSVPPQGQTPSGLTGR